MGATAFPVRINWLPSSRARTIQVAVVAEAQGFDGLGVTDTPRGMEVYTAVESALAATIDLRVGPNVTNPLTRAWSVHAAAMRSMREHGDRGFVGFGTGDSAVRASGGRPARADELRELLGRLRGAVEDPLPLLVAASGPRVAAVARDLGDGIVAGVGTSGAALRRILDGRLDLDQRWATLRVAVADDEADVDRLRDLVLPRAISAARFAFGSTFEGKDVPGHLHTALRDGFARYDFSAHGVAGRTANAGLFAGRPDIESYLVDRFAIVGTATEVCEGLRSLARDGFTGAYLSILFEDPVPEVERLGRALRAGGLLP